MMERCTKQGSFPEGTNRVDCLRGIQNYKGLQMLTPSPEVRPQSLAEHGQRLGGVGELHAWTPKIWIS